MVELTVDGQAVSGFVDARRQGDDVWEVYVDYSYAGLDGFPSHRRDWLPINELTVLTIDDVPQGDYVIPPR